MEIYFDEFQFSELDLLKLFSNKMNLLKKPKTLLLLFHKTLFFTAFSKALSLLNWKVGDKKKEFLKNMSHNLSNYTSFD